MVKFNELNKKQQKKILTLSHNIHRLTDFDLGLLIDICFDELKLRDLYDSFISSRGLTNEK